jgi:hypothetical protein
MCYLRRNKLVQDEMEWPPIGAISLSWLALA